MRRVAIFNDFQLPVPAVRGAVQQLITMLLDLNELDPRYEFDVYSCVNKESALLARPYEYTRFHFSGMSRLVRLYTNACLKMKLPFDIAAVPLPWDIKSVFKKSKYDAVYVSGYVRGLLSIAEACAGECPVYYHHHVVTDFLAEQSIRGEEIFNVCEKVAFVSQYACNKAMTGVSAYDTKIVPFCNCIDVGKFHDSAKMDSRRNLRVKYGFSESDVVFVFVGRIVENKGLFQLLEAFKSAFSGKPDAKLIVVGGNTYSSSKSSPYLAACKELAGDMPNQVFFTGYVPNSRLPLILAGSDVGCVPSVYEEACGLTSLEMMAAGLPIVTTDAGGLAEYVPSECKLVSEWKVGQMRESIVSGLACAMMQLYEDIALRLRMGQASSECA